jgi:hypothetical protein
MNNPLGGTCLTFSCHGEFELFPLEGLLLCLKVITINPTLITNDKTLDKEVGDNLTKLLTDFDASDRLSEIPSGQIYNSK